ncbi:MAG: LytTR family transcriptional regulator DNA-binding domain-containing protein [Bacteroidia bacterium]|nr:LytTR family transcriptional regulator DNA-binding domain-containing protein [Bacteroidia bacterium]
MNAEAPDSSYRQSAAILFADVAGYTALMQQHEQAALAMLKQYKQIIYEESPRFAGEVVQYYGDGCLLLFASAAEAARCAVSLQRAFRSQSPELSVRIGIHQGEVVRDEAHVYGDCVNIAARIESMGIPGAVLLSGEVQAALAEDASLAAAPLGKYALRHVSQPVEIFALTGDPLAVPKPEQLLRKGIAYQIDNTPEPSASLQILVVEDDMIVGAHISMVLAEAGYGVLGLMPTGEAALAQIRTLPPDLILMDVQLKGKLDGVDTAAQIYQEFRIPVIFLTANADAATFTRAKSAFPYAFIQKPFQPQALLRAIELVVQRIQEEQEAQAPAAAAAPAASPPRPDHLFVRDKDRMVKLKLGDIRYVEAERNYCRIHTQQRQYLLSTPMKAVEGHLDPEQFVRTHRSFVVNLAAIESLDEYYLYLGDQAIPLSKAYKDAVLQRLNRM